MKTIQELIKCVERECSLRRVVYPARVAQRKMSEDSARHQVECMDHIAKALKDLSEGKAGFTSCDSAREEMLRKKRWSEEWDAQRKAKESGRYWIPVFNNSTNP